MPVTVAHVVLGVPLKQIYRYSVPLYLADQIQVGHRISVDFHHRRQTAFVVSLTAEQNCSENLKPVLALEEPFPVFGRRDMLLARWIARRYLCTPGEVLRVMVPRLPRRKRNSSAGDMSCFGQVYPREDELILTPDQSTAIRDISDRLKTGRQHTVVLHGITGSGKTEVYLRVIAEVLNMNKSAIVLEPEIALTPQTVERFKTRFKDRVAVLHSKLSMGERGREWLRIKEGEAAICIGPRSAVFAPVNKLGLIVIDEEMETSYKQNEAPRYHAREVAIQRAKQAGAVVVIGSATPSLETYQLASRGVYQLLELPERVGGRTLPEVEIVDMKQELNERKNRTMFSHHLRECVAATLEIGGQVMLFVNRRAYSTFVQCRSCGEAIRCPNCQISLKFHFKASKLRCHYCEHSE
ncbi:MAG: primosomal protein N', partial [bacterium]|nr:primosomal protein N' [bacterium]